MLGLLGDKKNLVSLILSETQEPTQKDVPKGLESDFSKAHEALAGDMIEAFKEGNAEMASRCLKQFIKLYSKEDNYSVEEGE